jgi:phosphatidylinositol-4,5-bisphosphate 3-kinase catalytic subunit alpha/beta/delta
LDAPKFSIQLVMVDLMVPYEHWQRELLIPCTVECLLPTGIYIPLKTDTSITLSSLKAALWKEAQKYALYHLLEKDTEYVFVGVTTEAPFLQEFYDESRSIRDLRLFLPILKLKEALGNREEKKICHQISKRNLHPTLIRILLD